MNKILQDYPSRVTREAILGLSLGFGNLNIILKIPDKYVLSFHEFPSLSYIVNSVTLTVVIASSIAQEIIYISSDTFSYPASPHVFLKPILKA